MRIGYFAAKFPYPKIMENYSYGGSILSAYYLAIEMAKRNHKIDVFTTSSSSTDYLEKNNGIVIHRYGTNFKVLSSNISFKLFSKPIEHDLDIAHMHFDIPPAPLSGLIYKMKKSVPLVVTYHGDWVASYGGFIRRTSVALHNKYLVSKILSSADIIIVPSAYYIKNSIFLRNFQNKVVVIPNGINLNNFDIPFSKKECREKLGIPTDVNVLLYCGYLSPYKCPDILLKALLKVLKIEPNTILIFMGDGVMMNHLVDLSAKLSIKSFVKFVGFITDDLKKAMYYKSSDIFVLPSTHESFGIVNLEAMACGVPIVASKIGGIPDVVKECENGLLVSPVCSDAFADAINYLLYNTDLMKQMGADGKEKVKKYAWERISSNIEKVYRDLL